jgi:serine/alanine adding enzyme
MTTIVKIIKSDEVHLWDNYVMSHPDSTLYHLSGWKNIIEKTYGHKTYCLMAQSSSKAEAHSSQLINPINSINSSNSSNSINASNATNATNPINPINTSNHNIVGILPLTHLKHFLFGNSLISVPYFDLGGILADDENTGRILLGEALKLGKELKVENIELRHIEPLKWLEHSSKQTDAAMSYEPSTVSFVTRSHKVRMLLELPASSEELMKSFSSKLRSQIKKPIKEGLTSTIGGKELLNDFFKVFAVNMRDLGSPVHSRKMQMNVLEEFPDQSRIVIVYKGDQPIACGMVVGYRNILENPWASFLKTYSRLSPNMLLYWTMLEYACNNGFTHFDFGRSSPDEGTYKFKEQWGAKGIPLHWQYAVLKGQPTEAVATEKSKHLKAIEYWQKMPVWATKVVGPMIRKHIGL